MVPTARQLLTPNQLNAYLGKRPSACSTNLGWPWMRVESWRKPTGRGELHCPGGTHHELIVPLTGSSATLRRFADTEYESADPTLLNEFDLIPRGHENYWRWQGAGCQYASIDIAPEFLRQVAEEDEDLCTSTFELVAIAGGTDPCLRSVATSLVHEMEDEGSSGRLFAESLMISLAVRILHRCTVESPTIATTRAFPPRVLSRILERIEGNLARTGGLEELASIGGCGKSAFYRRFKLTTGVTPHQFVLSRRIARAKHLLRHSTQSLSQIALDTGFSSHAHFASAFVKHTGLTPATYRRERAIRKNL